MPKLKTHSGAKKRFKITARGKVVHKRAGARHLLQGMSAGRSRFLRRPGQLNTTQTRMIKRLLPYG
ncbi:MAG: 50S ribosomal protein L35 [Elusimicrobia bacterium]|nr:50S ribosomal protein L35 [Candidatus Obscuribacterium magneticum]